MCEILVPDRERLFHGGSRFVIPKNFMDFLVLLILKFKVNPDSHSRNGSRMVPDLDREPEFGFGIHNRNLFNASTWKI